MLGLELSEISLSMFTVKRPFGHGYIYVSIVQMGGRNYSEVSLLQKFDFCIVNLSYARILYFSF